MLEVKGNVIMYRDNVFNTELLVNKYVIISQKDIEANKFILFLTYLTNKLEIIKK